MGAIDWSKVATVLGRLISHSLARSAALGGREMDCSASIHSSLRCSESIVGSAERMSKINILLVIRASYCHTLMHSS